MILICNCITIHFHSIYSIWQLFYVWLALRYVIASGWCMHQFVVYHSLVQLIPRWLHAYIHICSHRYMLFLYWADPFLSLLTTGSFSYTTECINEIKRLQFISPYIYAYDMYMCIRKILLYFYFTIRYRFRPFPSTHENENENKYEN